MSDIVDKANDNIEMEEEIKIAGIRQKAAKIEPGKCGECDLCGEFSWRLIDGNCARCRDKWKLK